MKQKLCLCCALIHDPDLLILDEPTTGVDPLSRRQFWELIDRIRADRPGMSVLVATAYMEEAARFDWLVAMDAGRVLATGTPPELLSRTGTQSLEAAFVALLPEEKRSGHREVVIPPRPPGGQEVVIEAHDLTQRFGSFTAVDHVSFRIERGEIFGFFGANGCGKSTTMKMLCGLLPPSEGQAWLLGEPVDANDIAIRRKVGYMSQAFSLYSELSVRQNLVLHAQLFQVPKGEIPRRVEETACAVRPRPDHGRAARLAPPRTAAAPAASRGADPRARPADPRRADLGCGPGGTGRLLGAPDRALPPRQGHHFRLDSLHQRGRALRPDLPDERRKGAGHRHAGRRGQAARHSDAGRRLHRLPGRGGGEPPGRRAGAGGASRAGRGGRAQRSPTPPGAGSTPGSASSGC